MGNFRAKIRKKSRCIDENKCTGCLNCLEVCPFEAMGEEWVDSRRVARVSESICQGCGTCAAVCRSEAITMKGFTSPQLYSQIAAPFEEILKELEVEMPSH